MRDDRAVCVFELAIVVRTSPFSITLARLARRSARYRQGASCDDLFCLVHMDRELDRAGYDCAMANGHTA